MNVFESLKKFVVGFITGLFGLFDDEDLKPERIQFWQEQIDSAWKQEGDGVALLRTIITGPARTASDLAKTLSAELGRFGYWPDAVEVVGNVVSLRLTTASVGRLTERDYAAALLIDLTL